MFDQPRGLIINIHKFSEEEDYKQLTMAIKLSSFVAVKCQIDPYNLQFHILF